MQSPIANPDLSGHTLHSSSKLLISATLGCIALAVWLETRRFDSVFTHQAVLLPDPDDWMRLWRAEQIADGKALIIRNIAEVNPPTGMEMHWTAPVDYLVAIPGILWRALSHRPRAIAEAAAWVPVALGAIYIGLMIAFIRRGHDAWTAILCGLFIAISPAFHRNFRLGHCDHHCALEFLYLLAVGLWWAIRRFNPSLDQIDPSRRRIIASGVCMGIALWIAPQSMAVWLAILVGMIFAARNDTPEHRLWWVRCIAWWQASVAIIVWLGRIIERGYESGQMAIDRIGPFQAGLQTIVLLVLLCWVLRTRNIGISWNINIRIPILALVLTGITFIDLIGSLKGRNPIITGEFYRWSSLVGELQPLFLHVRGQWSFAQMHEQLGALMYALPVLAFFFAKDRGLPCGAKLTLLLLAFGFTLMSIFQRRWLDHVNLGLAPVCVIGVRVAAGALFDRNTNRSMLASALSAIAIFVIFIPTFAYSYSTLTADPDPLILRTLATARQINHFEADNPKLAGVPDAILSEDGEGPMLLDLTGHPIVAAPYHRDLDGIIAASRFFAERDPAKAAEILKEHQVRYIVVPFRSHEQLMNFEHMAYGEYRSYEPPESSIDEHGRLRQKLNYKPEVTQTMIYRLAMFKGQGVPGVRLISEVREGAPTPDGQSGLLYIVEPPS